MKNTKGMSHYKIMILTMVGVVAVVLLLAAVAPKLYAVIGLPLIFLICPLSMMLMMLFMDDHGTKDK